MMKIYLVGGAVRDKLLGLPIKERDWVVVGATPADMLKLGFRSVGKDFPVFLHPETNEEYALARTERKVGRGYTGFDFDTSNEVTLEEDLKRRDLTVNAMAEEPDGTITDPYQGQKDLQNKLLRHVSHAFVEDPVRILRIARFAARYAQYGFTVAPETLALMQQMVQSGEVDALVPERVWKELERALGEKNPEQFFLVLEASGALFKLFPMLCSTENNADFVGKNALLKVSSLTEDKQIRFAALVHALPEQTVKQLADQYRIPSDYKELAVLVVKLFSSYQKIITALQKGEKDKAIAQNILQLFLSADAFRRESRFQQFLQTLELLLGSQEKDAMRLLYEAAKKVNTEALLKAGVSGKALGEALNQARVEMIYHILSSS
jgi:tRNA nucleotidyltransferase (CCA-adding enzyme)